MEDFANYFDKEKISSLAKHLNKLSPTEFAASGCLLAIFLCEIISPDQQNTIGNYLEMVGQILLTSYAQAATVDPRFSSPSTKEFNNLVNQFIIFKNSKLK